METENKKANAKTFTKEQLMKSKSYEKERDILAVVLADDVKYTKAQVEKELDTFKKRRVK